MSSVNTWPSWWYSQVCHNTFQDSNWPTFWRTYSSNQSGDGNHETPDRLLSWKARFCSLHFSFNVTILCWNLQTIFDLVMIVSVESLVSGLRTTRRPFLSCVTPYRRSKSLGTVQTTTCHWSPSSTGTQWKLQRTIHKCPHMLRAENL